ncbi:MAG: hypothetical protein QM764_06100 [Chitinophagaceae bacterium]
MRVTRGYLAVFFIACANVLAAQKVLYSSYLNDRNTDRFEITGKAGDYYWILKNKKKNQVDLPAMPWHSDRQPSFDIYDNRLDAIATVTSAEITDTTVKEYFISGDRSFDNLILSGGKDKIYLTLDRYAPDGNPVAINKTLDTFDFAEQGNSFILLRSEDKEKTLLLCFQTIPDAPLQLHAVLFDRNWNILSVNKYRHPYITQPFVQYEFFNYPVEHFSTSSIKLSNNGDWMMVAPSGRNHDFSLFHFNGIDSNFVYKDIKLPASSSVEDVALSIDNDKQEAMAGILSRFRFSTLKCVNVATYSMVPKKISFDTSFRFNTLAGEKVRNENLYEESFVAVPGSGFMLLKEYGKGYQKTGQEPEDNIDPSSTKEILFSNNIASNATDAPVKNDDYTKYVTLAGSAQ